MEWFVALRYLRGKRRAGVISIITWISAGGVFLGSLVLVVALSGANGFEREVRDRIVGTLADAKIVTFKGNPIENYDSLTQVIRKHPQVVAAAPYIGGKGAVEFDQMQEYVMIMGVDAARETTVTEVGRKIKYGKFRLDSMESKRERVLPCVVIGIGLADRLGVRQGEEIVMGTLTTVDGAIDPTPRMARFVISGIFETGMYEYDLNLTYISIPSAQDLLAVKGVEGIQIKTTDMYQADKISHDVQEFIGGYPYRSMDWKSQNRSLFEWMKLEKIVIFSVISMIIVVAAFNIISSLIMMTLEKRREIGILMGMGATSGSIMRIFMFNGAIIGFLGSTLGVALGLLLCFLQKRYGIVPLPGDIYFINKLPVLVQPLDIVAIYVTANILSLLATIYPALLASRVLPAESMRYE
jgi:lipoprotein-releasing system permease protein